MRVDVTRVLVVFSVLMAMALAGCSDPPAEPGRSSGFTYVVDYDGGRRGDDNDLYVSYRFPTGQQDQWNRLANNPRDGADGGHGIDFVCRAHDPDWEGNWWVEISLHEEIDGDLINRQRMEIDCYSYWIHVDEEGGMELHRGEPPHLRNRGVPGPGGPLAVTLVLAGALHRRNRGRGL